MSDMSAQFRAASGATDGKEESLRGRLVIRGRASRRKGLAQEARSFQAVAPGQVDRLSDADPDARDDIERARSRVEGDRRPVERQAIMRMRDAERFRQFARP